MYVLYYCKNTQLWSGLPPGESVAGGAAEASGAAWDKGLTAATWLAGPIIIGVAGVAVGGGLNSGWRGGIMATGSPL